jgi:colicin import membrane protein
VCIFEYVDPKGRKPIAYTKVMKKYKISEEQVLEEAGKLNIVINPQHFVAPEETKRGRPKTEKEPKEKGVKGRPKKSKKVVEIKEDDDDLFATLVANANEDAEEMILPNEAEKEASVKAEKEAKKAAEKAAKEAEKAEKESKKAAEKAAEKAEKEAKLAAEKAEKEAKKAAEKAAKEAEKAEKEAKLAAEKAAKKSTAKKSAKPAKDEPAKQDEAAKEDEEQEVLKKIEYQGKKYLKSKKSGIIYDYDVYRATEDLVIIGKWNDNTNKIVFEKVDNDSDEESDEESEDEYDN